jgi:hypothetical protein
MPAMHLAVACRPPTRLARPVREACRIGVITPLDKAVGSVRSHSRRVQLLARSYMSSRGYRPCDAFSGNTPPDNKACKARSGGLPSGV